MPTGMVIVEVESRMTNGQKKLFPVRMKTTVAVARVACHGPEQESLNRAATGAGVTKGPSSGRSLMAISSDRMTVRRPGACIPNLLPFTSRVAPTLQGARNTTVFPRSSPVGRR